MTLEDQRSLARNLDAHVQRLRAFCPDGMLLLNALSNRMPDLRALMDAAGPAGMAGLARQFPNLGRFAELLAGLPRGVPSVGFVPLKPGANRSQGGACRPAPLPLRLHQAISILSRTGDPGAPDAQSACGEVAARIVMLEEALIALLAGAPGAPDRAQRVLAGG